MRALVRPLWQAAELVVFGSYQTGLYLPESDVDLVCIGTSTTPGPKRKRALHKLGDALRGVEWPMRWLLL